MDGCAGSPESRLLAALHAAVFLLHGGNGVVGGSDPHLVSGRGTEVEL